MKDFAAYFWSKVDKREPDECWPWKGERSVAGYGYIRVSSPNERRRRVTAHRVAYLLENGFYDLSLDMLHKCDNPPCCNPAHLWAGSEGDNIQDAISKGRFIPPGRGEAHNCNILTEDMVRDMKQLFALGARTKDIAAEFGVHASTISHIRNQSGAGSKWEWVE